MTPGSAQAPLSGCFYLQAEASCHPPQARQRLIGSRLEAGSALVASIGGAAGHERLVAPPAGHHLGVGRVVSGAEGQVLDAGGACLNVSHRILVEPDRVPFAKFHDLVVDLDPR